MIQYALEKGTPLVSSSKNLLGIPTGEKRVYTIEKALGQGGFGITYLATRKIGNIIQVFAIKEFFVKGQCWREAGNSHMMFPEAVEAKKEVKEWLHEFENEAKLLNEICQKTPNIVKVNEVFRANDTAYYVMEYLEGGSLRDVVKQGTLTEGAALAYILPVVKAVYMLHTMEQPLLHCDIKHDNIMLRKHINGVIEPVLIDFGESRHFNEDGNLTTTHTTAGCSRGFAPMEQYLGITTFTPQVDVYALAATLYYIVTGDEPPFADDVTEERIRRKLPVSLSDSLTDAIVHGMQKDKDKRTCDTRTFYKEVSGKDIGDVRPETIVSPELPIGYTLKNKGKQYEIVSVFCSESYYIRYKVTCADVGMVSTHGQTRRIQFDIYEFFDKKNNRRQEDKSVIADGNTDTSQKQFLSLCKKITRGEINGEFREGSTLGWATFTSNNTFYLVDTHYRKSLPWKKIFTSAGVSIGIAFLVVGAISIYNSIKEASIKERLEMSQRLTHAIINNRADSLRIFAEDFDSVRAYLPYAKICFDNKDIETAKKFVEKAEKASHEDSMAILILNADIHDKNILVLQQNKMAKKEQAFNSLYNVAKKQYDDKQYILARETLNKIDSEFLSRKEVIELLKNIEKYLVTTVNPVSPAKVKEQTGTQTESKSDDELYRDAIRKSDWKTLRNLADKGYSKAYIPLAKHYLNSPSTHNLADKYAQKAKKFGIAGAEDIIKTLEIYEYY